MIKKLFNFLLLSNGITPTDADEPVDKWSRFREEREAWEREQNMNKAAPVQTDARQMCDHQ